jgi:hypothetical protein
MNFARELLDELAVIGATVEPSGDRLILRAGPAAIPAALVNRVRDAKADLIVTLARHGAPQEQERSGNSAERQFKHRPFEACIVEWLNQRPTPSAPGRCAFCGRLESSSAVVLPFGTEPETHTWLHADCWSAWHQARRAEATESLRATGHTLDSPLPNDHDR